MDANIYVSKMLRYCHTIPQVLQRNERVKVVCICDYGQSLPSYSIGAVTIQYNGFAKKIYCKRNYHLNFYLHTKINEKLNCIINTNNTINTINIDCQDNFLY